MHRTNAVAYPHQSITVNLSVPPYISGAESQKGMAGIALCPHPLMLLVDFV